METDIVPDIVRVQQAEPGSTRSAPEAPAGDDPSRALELKHEQRIEALAALEDGWNSYRAPPIDRGCLERVRPFVAFLEDFGGSPWITPMSCGGVAVERCCPDDYMVEIETGGTVNLSFMDLSDADAFRLLQSWMAICDARDSDRSGEAGETRSGSTEGKSAGLQGIAQPPSKDTPNA